MIDGLLLLSKNDIPFISAQLSIHQPTLKEIGLIGEEAFFVGAQFLTVNKNAIRGASVEELAVIHNFDIIMQLVNDTSPASRFNKACAESLLTLMFPEYKIMFLPNALAFVKDGENHLINKDNFDEFQQIVSQMFCLDSLSGHPLPEYDPANKQAERIVNKIKQGRDKLNELKSQQNRGQKITILSRYISILAVGEQKDLNALMQYSVYQLFDEFNRFSLREQSDFYLEAKMAGAKDLQEVDNWMKDIHSNSEQN